MVPPHGSRRWTDAHAELSRRLEAGELVPGARLAPERVLAAELGVSRATLRVALDRLEADRLVVRRHGSGTYVAEPRMSVDTSVLVSFTDGVLHTGLVPGARLLACEVVGADHAAARALEVDEGEAVWRLVRLRTANGAPMALERSWFPHFLLGDLDRHDLEGRSIYRILAEEYDLAPDRATQRLEPVAADEAAGAALGCRVGDPLMMVTRTAVTERSVPVEFACDLYLPARTSFITRARVRPAQETGRDRPGRSRIPRAQQIDP